MTNLWARLRAGLHQLRYTEPALLRAHVTAILTALAGAGITIPGVVNRWVGIALTVLAVAAPYYQGRRTRADVWSQATVDDLAQLIALFPDLADRATQLLHDGIPPELARAQLERASLAADPPGAHAADLPAPG